MVSALLLTPTSLMMTVPVVVYRGTWAGVVAEGATGVPYGGGPAAASKGRKVRICGIRVHFGQLLTPRTRISGCAR
uniref:Putative secreted protein n=1 Tax=Anopheles triannulatus TaxID=58253 RepID=A0A2M4B5D9_9DIPT